LLKVLPEALSKTTLEQHVAERVPTDSDSTEYVALVQESALSDFTNFDPNDTVFQEFNPPLGCCGKMAWKLSRPSTWRSMLLCFKAVFTMQVVFGSSIGLLAVAVILLDLNTADLCYEKTFKWDSIPPLIQSIRVTGQCVEGFFIEIWHFFDNAMHVWLSSYERTQSFNDKSPRCLYRLLLSPLPTDVWHLQTSLDDLPSKRFVSLYGNR